MEMAQRFQGQREMGHDPPSFIHLPNLQVRPPY